MRFFSLILLLLSFNSVLPQLITDFYIDGLDTIYEMTEPETERLAHTGLLNEVNRGGVNYKTGGDSAKYKIQISIGSQMKEVNPGMHGYHLEGMFGRKNLPNDNSSLQQWQWLIDLKPTVVRVFGGSTSKFMHLLDGPGYGYDLEEIIRYYDHTDTLFNAPDFNEILDSLNSELFLGGWIDELQVNNIRLYPNPTSGTFYILVNNSAFDILQIRLIDISGRITDIPNSGNFIDISDLPPGVYVVQTICSNDQIFYSTIIKV